MNKKYVDSQKLLSNQPSIYFFLINKNYLSEFEFLDEFCKLSTKKSLFILENSIFPRRFSNNKGNRN